MQKCSFVALALLTIGFVAALLPALATAQPPPCLDRMRAFGAENGRFSNPKGISMDESGNIHAKDIVDRRIQKFRSNGTFLAKWDTEGSSDRQSAPAPPLLSHPVQAPPLGSRGIGRTNSESHLT